MENFPKYHLKCFTPMTAQSYKGAATKEQTQVRNLDASLLLYGTLWISMNSSLGVPPITLTH